jgi:hypothetical protein
MPKNLHQYIQSPAHQWWINPTDMRRPKKIILLYHLFNIIIKLIIF